MSQLRMRVLCAVLLCSAWACGDDDDSGKKDDAGLLRDAGGPANPGGSGGSGGSIGAGDEGYPCLFSAGECNKGLTCVENIFQDENMQPLGVCARACKTDPDCASDEKCFSYTSKDTDSHCVNLVDEEYGVCGVGDTSVCKDRSCLYFPNSPFGVCIDTCVLGEGESDAGTDDGGTPQDGVPSGAVSCRTGETCVDEVLSAPMSNEGVCGTVVARGDECGIDVGKYCNHGDICAPEDPTNLMSTPRCFENCSDSGMCKKGSCMVVQNAFAYCM
jgi:hypothetical protein